MLRNDDLWLAECLMARFAHDIAGPLGALSNGLDFLQQLPNLGFGPKAMELLESGSRDAVARLQFFRQAFGSIQQDEEVGVEVIRKIAYDYIATMPRIFWSWAEDAEASAVFISHANSKLLLSLVMGMSSSLPYGGELIVDTKHLATRGEWSVAVVSKRQWTKPLEIEDYLPSVMDADLPAPNSRNIHLHYMRRYLASTRACMVVDKAPDRLLLTLTLPD